MDDQFRILLIDDSSDDRVLIRRALKQELGPLEVCEVGDAAALERALNAEPYDLVITDYNLGFTDGFTLLDALKARWPDCPVILCTGSLSEEIAVAALRKGLDDYVLKDQQRVLRLPAAVRSAVGHARQRAAARAAEVRYQALFEDAPVGLVQSLPDGRMLAANPAAARIWVPSVVCLKKKLKQASSVRVTPMVITVMRVFMVALCDAGDAGDTERVTLGYAFASQQADHLGRDQDSPAGNRDPGGR